MIEKLTPCPFCGSASELARGVLRLRKKTGEWKAQQFNSCRVPFFGESPREEE